ncbi:MAG: hypothetical protein ACE5OQ_09885, partial [Woeseia sp.]
MPASIEIAYGAGPGLGADPALTALDEALGRSGDTVGDLRLVLGRATDNLIRRFEAGEPVTELVRLRAALVDRVLSRLWRK